MVTILLSGFDQDTEAGITQTHSGMPLAEVKRTVALVRAFRDAGLKMATLGEDKEVQELLLRKIRERGLAGKLLMKAS